MGRDGQDGEDVERWGGMGMMGNTRFTTYKGRWGCEGKCRLREGVRDLIIKMKPGIYYQNGMQEQV